jgi:signal transduction histidine kinase/CheY-like chemotaxis protein
VTETLEHRLGAASDVAHALLDHGGQPPTGTAERTRRNAEALALWDASQLPSAVFLGASRIPARVNAAWRKLFDRSSIAVQALSAIDDVVRTSAAMHLPELPLASTDGPAYCAATLRPLRGADGETAGVIIVCAVTTDAVLARKYHVDASALLWSDELAGGLPWLNGQWLTYTGTTAKDPWQQAIHPDDLPRCLNAFQEARRQRTSDVEVRIRGANRGYRWHRVRFSTDDASHRWFGTATDQHDEHMAHDERTELLSQAQSARADAEQANRLKDQFLAAVSHELRSPMTTLLLWEKVLHDDSVGPEVRAQALAAIRSSALSQSRLVGDLLDISRAISGKLFVDLRAVDLAQVCREAVVARSPEAASKGVTLTTTGLDEPKEIQGDPVRLRQIVDNILTNAITFSDGKGEVVVSILRKGRQINLVIKDAGRGIAPEFIPHLFQAFSQTDDLLTRARGGLGLGLAIVKQLVELHHGHVAATSAGLGRGTTLTISLPASDARSAMSPAAGVPVVPSLDGIRVLLIDDDPRVRGALELLLGRAGAGVDTATSAEMGREKILEQQPTIIVCDIAMPGEDGYSFIRSLRKAGSALPAIALTAHAMATDAVRATEAGFDRHLAKPIDFDHLVATLHAVLAVHPRTP